jgi:hypothetical protein
MPSPIQAALIEIARDLEKDWRERDYRECEFARLSAERLAGARLHERFAVEEILSELACGEFEEHHFLSNHHFKGIVPLYDSARFGLYLHLWYDEIASPHEHTWVGAYQVLSGTSITSLYHFEEHARIDPHLRLGALIQGRIDMIGPGAAVPVERGANFIHSLAYVERPGIAVSIRSHGVGLPFEYYAPGLAIDAGLAGVPERQRLRSLEGLAALSPEKARALWPEAVAAADFRTAFFMVKHATLYLGDQVDTSAILEHARFAPHSECILGALDEMRRFEMLERARRSTHHLEHRFLLAALSIAPTRAILDRLIREYYPGADPKAFITSCLIGLAQTPGEGGLSALGTLQHVMIPRILPLALEGADPLAVQRFLKVERDLPSDADAETILAACGMLRQLPLLRPLF